MWQAINPLTTAAFGMGCVAFGAAITVIAGLVRRPRDHEKPIRIDPRLDADLSAWAQHWAGQRGTPELGHYAHHRLRMAVGLQQRTRDRYSR